MASFGISQNFASALRRADEPVVIETHPHAKRGRECRVVFPLLKGKIAKRAFNALFNKYYKKTMTYYIEYILRPKFL